MNPILNEIMKKYKQDGDVKACNEALKAAGMTFSIMPGKNEISAEELAKTSVGKTPAEANGYGLLDMGVGLPDKVKVTNGKLDHPINEASPDGKTNMKCFVSILDKRYEVKGDTLV